MNTEKIQLGCKIEYNPPLPTVTISKNAKIVKRIFVMQSNLKFKKAIKWPYLHRNTLILEELTKSGGNILRSAIFTK